MVCCFAGSFSPSPEEVISKPVAVTGPGEEWGGRGVPYWMESNVECEE
jgi:hypothetical protein